MAHNFLVCRSLIPADSLRIGRLVIDIEDPLQDYLDLFTSVDPKIVEVVHPDDRSAGSASSKTFVDFLAGLASTALSRSNNRAITVEARSAKTYAIADVDSWFKEACKDEDTQKWLEDMVLAESVHVIVGYHTLAEIRLLDGEENQNVPDKAQNETGRAQEEPPAIVLQESICAIRYAKVSLSWISSDQVDQAIIDQRGLWHSHQAVRGERESYVVDTRIEEDLEYEDILEKSIFGSDNAFIIQR